MRAVGGGSVELYTDQVGAKHGDVTESQGGRTYYHQDSSYWNIGPELGCNCWIPFTEMAADACTLAFLPGSHRSWVIEEHEKYFDEPAFVRHGEKSARHRIPLQRVDARDEVLCEVSPGDGLFFSTHTWHRSEPNRTGETKGYYAIAYQRREEGEGTSV